MGAAPRWLTAPPGFRLPAPVEVLYDPMSDGRVFAFCVVPWMPPGHQIIGKAAATESEAHDLVARHLGLILGWDRGVESLTAGGPRIAAELRSRNGTRHLLTYPTAAV